MAHSASTDYHSSSYKIFVFVDLPLFTMADTQRDVKSLGDRLIKKFSVREKSNGIPIVKRKTSKPLTEKRRRDRINKCLVQLKNIIFRAKGKDEKKFARLEKADILEMTIGHLMEIHGQGKVPQLDADSITEPSMMELPDIYGCMRRVNAVNDLDLKHRDITKDSEPSIYPNPHRSMYPMTPRYYCGNSGNVTIAGVNFDPDDMLEGDSVMCGSASRVFVMEDGSYQTSAMIQTPDVPRQKWQNKISPISSMKDNVSLGQGYHHGNVRLEADRHEPKYTSTPLQHRFRTSTPVMGVSGYSLKVTPPGIGHGHMPKTSTPICHDRISHERMSHDRMPHERIMDCGMSAYKEHYEVISPENMMSIKGQGHCSQGHTGYNLDISHDLRTRLFSSSSTSDSADSNRMDVRSRSDGQSVSRSSSSSSGQSTSSNSLDGELWQPWK